jgi:Family of unknown function (DUF6279)
LPAAMMITFTAMRRSLSLKTWIIGLVVLALSGCSAVRLGYDNGPSLALWWLDGYLDLDRAQEARAKPALQDWFDWHRSTQLPDYARLLATWQARSTGSVTGDEICGWSDQVRDKLQTAVERALPAAAQLLPQVGAAQWQFLEKRFAERAAELRADHAQARPEDRQAAALDRAVDRSEQFYGRLSAAQKKLLADSIASTPMASEEWIGERETRQRALVQGLRRAQQEPDEARRLAALRSTTLTYLRPADGAYGERQARWQAHSCALSARLHNSTTPAQREHLRERLAAWQEDMQALAAAAAP